MASTTPELNPVRHSITNPIMRLLTSISVLAAVVPSVLGQVTFTKPDVNQKLNLSAESITIAWTLEPNSQPAKENPQVDLWWCGEGFGHELTANLSTAPGITSFEWKPEQYRDSFVRNKWTFTTAKTFFFELEYHAGPNGTARPQTFRSEKYAIEGYPNMKSGIGRHGSNAAFVMGLAGLVGVAVFF